MSKSREIVVTPRAAQGLDTHYKENNLKFDPKNPAEISRVIESVDSKTLANWLVGNVMVKWPQDETPTNHSTKQTTSKEKSTD